jgi:wyosine [tRNA(Phe)-imidazoG37] synthetase (radical SAM superfamily)
LGRSLGIDIVPFKTCTYDCIYCQLGRTTNKTIERRDYVGVADILTELERKLAAGPAPDYITISGSGEPTLNAHIGDLVAKIKDMTRIPLAILTNGSLLWMNEVQEALMQADLVLPSLDAGDDVMFRYVNRPHKDISFGRVVDGLAGFRERFPGQVWLEVFLLAGATGIPSRVRKIAALTRHIQPARVQLNTVSRPPAEEFASSLSRDQMRALTRFFPGEVDIVIGTESGAAQMPVSSEAEDCDILALLSRRPCTSQDIAGGLGIHVTEALTHLRLLFDAGKVHTMVTGGRIYFAVSAAEQRIPSS